MTFSADQIMKPLTMPDARARMIHNLPARVQTTDGDVLAHRALAQLRILLQKNEKLRECEPSSIYSCLIAAFGLNLEPNTTLQHCFLVPFAGECKLVMGYRGLIELARRGSKIKAITAEAVYEDDHFYMGLGTENRIEHRPVFSEKERPLIAAYTVAFYDPQNYQFVVMQRHEIDKVRKVSRGSDHPKSAWSLWFSEMAKKCPLKRLCKLLPQNTDDLAIALDHDDRYEIGKTQDIPRMPLPAGLDLLPDGTPRSEASLAQKMAAGTKEQESGEQTHGPTDPQTHGPGGLGAMPQVKKLRTDINQMIEKIPEAERQAIVNKVCESVGLFNYVELVNTREIDKLVNAADRLEAALGEFAACEQPSVATNTDDPPPAADDEIMF